MQASTSEASAKNSANIRATKFLMVISYSSVTFISLMKLKGLAFVSCVYQNLFKYLVDGMCFLDIPRQRSVCELENQIQSLRKRSLYICGELLKLRCRRIGMHDDSDKVCIDM